MEYKRGEKKLEVHNETKKKRMGLVEVVDANEDMCFCFSTHRSDDEWEILEEKKWGMEEGVIVWGYLLFYLWEEGAVEEKIWVYCW